MRFFHFNHVLQISEKLKKAIFLLFLVFRYSRGIFLIIYYLIINQIARKTTQCISIKGEQQRAYLRNRRPSVCQLPQPCNRNPSHESVYEER